MTASVLHITSGDRPVADVRALVGVEPRIEPVREALIDGPLPVGLDQDAWEAARSRWLAGRYGLSLEEMEAEQARLSQLIEDAARAESVVLWFDDDLFCMRTLLMILHRLALHETSFDQRIQRATLTESEPRYTEISASMLMAAADAWRTIAAQDAAEIAAHGSRLADVGQQWLADAMLLELQWRILRVRSRVEVSNIVADGGAGGMDFPELFARWNQRHAQLGLGDWQVWLLTAAAARRGTVHMSGAEPVPASLHDQTFGQARIYPSSDENGGGE